MQYCTADCGFNREFYIAVKAFLQDPPTVFQHTKSTFNLYSGRRELLIESYLLWVSCSLGVRLHQPRT